MTTRMPVGAAKSVPADSMRKTALVAGVLVIATLFGGLRLGSPMPSALLVAAWELSLGVWLVVKGFKPSVITTGMTATADRDVLAAAAPAAYTGGSGA